MGWTLILNCKKYSSICHYAYSRRRYRKARGKIKMLVANNSAEEINKAILALQQQISSINTSVEALKKAIKENK